MSDDVERIELFIAHHIPDIVTALLFPLILVSYMFAVDWRLAIVVLAVLAMAFYVMGRMYTGKNPGGFQTVCGDLRQNEC